MSSNRSVQVKHVLVGWAKTIDTASNQKQYNYYLSKSFNGDGLQIKSYQMNSETGDVQDSSLYIYDTLLNLKQNIFPINKGIYDTTYYHYSFNDYMFRVSDNISEDVVTSKYGLGLPMYRFNNDGVIYQLEWSADHLSSHYKFDVCGNLIEIKTIDTLDGPSTTRTTYVYDDNNKCTSEQDYNIMGKLSYETKMNYDSLGHLIHQKNYRYNSNTIDSRFVNYTSYIDDDFGNWIERKKTTTKFVPFEESTIIEFRKIDYY
jgi:hypothetical protein